MTRTLILGGTAWLGREIAAAAVARGGEVVCLARGESGTVAEGARLVRADRRDPAAYDELVGEWDDVVELSSDPALVGPALRALADRASHWTLVSSVSVYADTATPGADESAELVDPVDTSRYADAKVAAERESAGRLGDRLLVVRPGLVVGPGDPSDRFGWWPGRMHRGGRVVVPTTEGRWVQAVDVADLAAFVERAGREGVVGTVDAVGEPVPLEEFLREARVAVGSQAAVSGAVAAGAVGPGAALELVTVDDATLLAAGVSWWAGPRSLPLWLPLDAGGFVRRSGAAYVAAGGVRRPLHETVERVLADELARGRDRPRRAGLDPADEAAVLAVVDARVAPRG
ncbi:reductase [Frigoribacterium sp. Leaf164]|uniref:NAD-dependent epimerase/dehydratase family protein n=1 Tax=Frigoribacterium sp. Leaf164 TaxID=1736282 RepID=UPI0006FB9029|nr:NAD-dependent epimerase/dehydratase family protein [Frigoribacterium sp. Leaf164]KQR44600.1 reductase [Frigoribacterium sp. Leaf164]